MNVTIGVINPYALGELVAEKSIQWNTVQEPKKMLAEILNLSEEEIFDIKNPILNPRIKIESDGKVKVLSENETKTRLETFFKGRTRNTVIKKLTKGIKMTAEVETKIQKIILSSVVKELGTSIPWMPTDKEWFDKGDFFKECAELNDPIQGALADCYYIAALSSVAWARPYCIVNATRPSGWNNDSNPIHRTMFYKDGIGAAQTVEVSELVPVVKTSRAWAYARSNDVSEIWPAVMEKAYAKWRTGNTTDFPNLTAIEYGDPVMACAQLMSGSRTYINHDSCSADDVIYLIRSNSLTYRTFNPMVAWTYGAQPTGTNYDSANVVANHAYSVLGWDYYNNEYYVVLRNPWGTHHATLDTRAGTWTPYQISYYANIPLNFQGVFSMKLTTYKKYFAGTGVVK
jgi:hypothetical protein